ncbi:hypothetical protein F4820DRAFT_372871 [Hypoxylon rubiginosum]|uniref:Uncharacterized protein n=1 Tax=Hypoxylon rubiginosum TaxID=110542 RepID=A0ACB9YWN4_9PEZI|nr:hypothetical protein F4820DRAFT_372871 [Hypoxylon rubiginosum]
MINSLQCLILIPTHLVRLGHALKTYHGGLSYEVAEGCGLGLTREMQVIDCLIRKYPGIGYPRRVYRWLTEPTVTAELQKSFIDSGTKKPEASTI